MASYGQSREVKNLLRKYWDVNSNMKRLQKEYPLRIANYQKQLDELSTMIDNAKKGNNIMGWKQQ